MDYAQASLEELLDILQAAVQTIHHPPDATSNNHNGEDLAARLASANESNSAPTPPKTDDTTAAAVGPQLTKDAHNAKTGHPTASTASDPKQPIIDLKRKSTVPDTHSKQKQPRPAPVTTNATTKEQNHGSQAKDSAKSALDPNDLRFSITPTTSVPVIKEYKEDSRPTTTATTATTVVTATTSTTTSTTTKVMKPPAPAAAKPAVTSKPESGTSTKTSQTVLQPIKEAIESHRKSVNDKITIALTSMKKVEEEVSILKTKVSDEEAYISKLEKSEESIRRELESRRKDYRGYVQTLRNEQERLKVLHERVELWKSTVEFSNKMEETVSTLQTKIAESDFELTPENVYVIPP
ncbi:hypothetical protein HDV05_008224 [Chytridiales sp. JEL 0842]|nr:hypothetical protein HDV05_008224 [Chytridiales sp. JEL 0842]